MRKPAFLALTALLLAVLCCACSAKTPAQQAPSAAQTETAKTEVQPQQTVSMEAVPVKTGVVNDGSSFYYYGQDARYQF